MKKRFVFLFLNCFFMFSLFAMSFNESERLHNGDLTLLDSEVSEFALSKLTNEDLRLFRNMIFAKYGYSFKSEDLQNFFNQFEWYKPGKDVTVSMFSKNERNLYERIQIFEKRDESLPSIKFGKEIIGLWHLYPVMPDTWSCRYLIYPNFRIEFLESYFDENPEVQEYIGHYEIKGNVLVFYVDKIKSKGNYISLSEPEVFKFPVRKIKQIVFGDGELTRQQIGIGSCDYYLISNDIETMGKWSRE